MTFYYCSILRIVFVFHLEYSWNNLLFIRKNDFLILEYFQNCVYVFHLERQITFTHQEF